jgi:hypothetical protein
VEDVSRALDEPLVTWSECFVGQDNPEGVIVALPHDADRLDVGLAIANTEWGRACYLPQPGGVTVRQAWARLFTLREQWEWAHDGDPPADWFPDESIPSWVEDAHGSEVWIAEWT